MSQWQISLIDGCAIGIERHALTPNATGGVQALVEASDELGRQLADC